MQDAVAGHSSSHKTFEEMLLTARGGSSEALETLLGMFREYLELLAGGELEMTHASPDSASVLIQQTHIEAQRKFEQFRGESSSELRAWLKQILVRNLIEPKWVNLENAPWERPTNTGATHLSIDETGLGEGHTSGSRPASTEMEIRILDAIDLLPDESRTVLQLHHFENRSFPEIGKKIGQSSEAVQKLWYRALRQLNQKMRHLT